MKTIGTYKKVGFKTLKEAIKAINEGAMVFFLDWWDDNIYPVSVETDVNDREYLNARDSVVITRNELPDVFGFIRVNE